MATDNIFMPNGHTSRGHQRQGELIFASAEASALLAASALELP